MTREEAINIVRDIYQTDKEKEALATLIPELAESEDERIKKIITDSVFYQYGAGVEYKDVLDYLDKLEKQKAQKPAEWSEEDEEHLKSIISTIEMCMKDCEDAKYVLGYYDSDISWLRSLRPSWKPSEVCYGQKGDPDPAGVWKPSEEQMKALWDAYKGGEGQEPLRELIEQLKKL